MRLARPFSLFRSSGNPQEARIGGFGRREKKEVSPTASWAIVAHRSAWARHQPWPRRLQAGRHALCRQSRLHDAGRLPGAVAVVPFFGHAAGTVRRCPSWPGEPRLARRFRLLHRAEKGRVGVHTRPPAVLWVRSLRMHAERNPNINFQHPGKDVFSCVLEVIRHCLPTMCV